MIKKLGFSWGSDLWATKPAAALLRNPVDLAVGLWAALAHHPRTWRSRKVAGKVEITQGWIKKNDDFPEIWDEESTSSNSHGLNCAWTQALGWMQFHINTWPNSARMLWIGSRFKILRKAKMSKRISRYIKIYQDISSKVAFWRFQEVPSVAKWDFVSKDAEGSFPWNGFWHSSTAASPPDIDRVLVVLASLNLGQSASEIFRVLESEQHINHSQTQEHEKTVAAVDSMILSV